MIKEKTLNTQYFTSQLQNIKKIKILILIIYSFINQILTEYLLSARYCFRCWDTAGTKYTELP